MAGVRRNGKAYDSADVEIAMLGSIESEVMSCAYSVAREHQVNHSLGAEGTSWSMGKVSREGKLSLYMNSARKLEKLAPNGDITLLAPFTTNVTFTNEFNEIVNDTIVWKFQNMGRDITGEMGLGFEYEMFVLSTSFNNL